MDAWFIVFLVIAIIGSIVIGAAWLLAEKSIIAIGTTAVLALIIGAFFFMTTFTTIGVKTVGVATQFGKTGTTMGSGWHWKTPTAAVHKWDGSLQTDLYSDDKNDAGDSMEVRLARGGQAWVTLQIQWRINTNHFDTLFNDYKELDHVKDRLIKPKLQAALIDVFAPYSPIDELKDGRVARSYTDFSSDAKKALSDKFSAEGVQLVDLTIRNLKFDENTQNSLNSLQQAIAQTAKAKQDEQTNIARALANNALGVTKVDPCNLLADLAAKGQLNQLPVNAITCGGNGQPAPVIIGNNK